MEIFDVIVIGGGPAGIFAAISAKEKKQDAKVLVLEKTNALLSKVKISGGGRCNVTNGCLDPKLLSQNYPRGAKELLPLFYAFGSKETINWFETRGVKLKIEEDGRAFPKSDKSQTIIDALLSEAKTLGVEILLNQKILDVEKSKKAFLIKASEKSFLANSLLLATSNSPEGFEWARKLGHSIQKPIPSLFAFNVPSFSLKNLSGVSVSSVNLKIKDAIFSSLGPILITHFGFSGPAILKLSAWGARYLNEKDYKFELKINWVNLTQEDILSKLLDLKKTSKKTLFSENIFNLPKTLYTAFLDSFKDLFKKKLSDIANKELNSLAQKLHEDIYFVDGKTANKQEFVTCGGITLKEINFKTMESKICPNLFFAGEILDIDGITGGFNFQNCWTTGYIAGKNSV
ncbi:MAG: NAD(P)/FAD-dependent oxidoreductase [Chlamydiae bacterium]|nr:NAD(P)/FAD-dependent oxidoreductase [Chlamydiota bacterium]